MARNFAVSVNLTSEERDWVRRKAYWEQISMSDIFRNYLHELVRQDGYLRPPDEESQDFGYEKEMMQFVQTILHEE